jgi:hypothetical protein
MIELMRSNQNLQFVLDAYGAATYIIDYISKSDRGMSNVMREVLKQVREGNETLRRSLINISNTFYNNSELSIQEACYNILQLHLSESSEECIFIPTFPQKDRVKLLISQEELEKLDDRSTDIFASGLLEHYVKRPISLENLTLAEFAADYRYSSIKTKNAIALQNKTGFISKRIKSRIIRYRNYHYETDPEDYIREHVMLYIPWRNEEEEDILNANLENIFVSNKENISTKNKLFNSFDDKVMDVALQEASERYENEDSHPNITESPNFAFDDFALKESDNYVDIENEMQDNNNITDVKFLAPQKMLEDDYQQLFEKLNQDQRDYITHTADHFQNSNKQLLHFVTGGAGVGKSLLIKALYQTLYRFFNMDSNSNPDDPKILLCAPTGKASFNIGGQTLHSAFKLPLNQKHLHELSAAVSNMLSNKLHALKVIIIDEVSMVGQHILGMVDQRLRHLFDQNKPFGNISIITVGDFFQLKPVCARPLFYPTTTNPYAEIFSKHPWHQFKVFELTKIMRQDEPHCQQALNNLARGRLTKKDIKLFKSRTFSKLPRNEDLTNATHLFSRNEDVAEFNQKILRKMKGKETTSEASDILRGRGTVM